MYSSDKFYLQLTATLAIAAVLLAGIISYAIVTANKNALAVHRSAYEQCASAINDYSRYNGNIAQCQGLSNERPDDTLHNK